MYFGVHLDKHVFYLCKVKNRNYLNFLWWNLLAENIQRQVVSVRHRKLGMFIFFSLHEQNMHQSECTLGYI
jgi:hypothetical protein